MPYVDPELQRQHERARYFWKYFADPQFRETESARKAAWYRKNKKRILARLLAARRRRARERAEGNDGNSTNVDAPRAGV